jgi:uncharacterized protein
MVEWNKKKAEKNLQKHKVSFSSAAVMFNFPTYELVDDRKDYGEERILAIGQVGDVVLFVVYTWRGEARRIISARPANRDERERYRAFLAGRAAEG